MGLLQLVEQRLISTCGVLYSPWGRRGSDTTDRLSPHCFTHKCSQQPGRAVLHTVTQGPRAEGPLSFSACSISKVTLVSIPSRQMLGRRKQRHYAHELQSMLLPRARQCFIGLQLSTAPTCVCISHSDVPNSLRPHAL